MVTLFSDEVKGGRVCVDTAGRVKRKERNGRRKAFSLTYSPGSWARCRWSRPGPPATRRAADSSAVTSLDGHDSRNDATKILPQLESLACRGMRQEFPIKP